jgi:hypothetical protein|tara:strand:- start:1256 stop:1462 length:207 start_codon:yes stop_codon:yes gene_type:complete
MEPGAFLVGRTVLVWLHVLVGMAQPNPFSTMVMHSGVLHSDERRIRTVKATEQRRGLLHLRDPAWVFV